MKIFVLIVLALTMVGSVAGTIYFVIKEMKKGA